MDIMIFAYLDNNIGDDLMVKLLAESFPQHRFLLYSRKSVIKSSFESIDNIVIRQPELWIEDMKTASVFLSVGGSIFQAFSRPQKRYRFRRIRKLKKLKAHGLKIVTMGSNLGPYKGWLGAKLIEWELRLNDLVTVRDQEAVDLLEAFRGIKQVVLADDLVYNLEKSERAPEKSCGLGIAAYRSIRPWETNFDNYRFLARLADAYIHKTGKSVRLFAFDSEDENDLWAAHQIYQLAEEKEGLSIVPYLGDQEGFLSSFQSCERMLAIRFHSAILADLYQIPFLPVAYSNKMQNLLTDRGYQGLSYLLEELNSELNADMLAEEIIQGDRLFNDFIGDRHNAHMHFEAFAKLLESLEAQQKV